MAQIYHELSPLREIYCINCHEELVLDLAERRGEENIVCPKCKTSFTLGEANKFMKNVSPILEGQCPSCWEDLTFDIEDRTNKGEIECPLCKELFYMTEVLNPSTQVIERKTTPKNPSTTSPLKEDENPLGKVAEHLEDAYKAGYLIGYQESVTLFSKLFEDMYKRNELNSKLFVRDIYYKVSDIQSKKDFSNIYTLNVPEDTSKAQRAFLKKFIRTKNENFEKGYKEGELVLVNLYFSFNTKIFIKQETLIKEVREKLVELMRPIKDFI